MPIVCVWIPAFRLAVARLTQDVALDTPVIVADTLERGRVVDCSLPAAALGVRPGMTLVQAQAVANEARTVVDDPVRDEAIWATVLEALDAASPLVEDAGWGRAFLEMHGIEGRPAGWIGAARNALAGFDLPLRIGLGPNPFTTLAAAVHADGTICDGDPAAFLAPFPLEQLNCGDDVCDRLRLLGIRTLGELAALPHGPFVRRFGPAAAHWHEWARGIDRRRLRPRPRALRIDRSSYGEGEATSEEAVLFALRSLVGRVADDLSAAGKRAGQLVLALECENGDVRELTTRVAAPTAVPRTLFDLLRARLEGVVLDAPVVGLRLVAAGLEDGGVPLALFAAADPDPDALGIVLARLDAALGDGGALRSRIIDGPRVERRFAHAPFTLEPLVTTSWTAAPPAPLPQTATLQFRPVAPQAVAVRVIGGAPRFVGTPAQTVLDAAGPWRVEEDWWAQPLVRDEYDVLLDDGSLVRIAHESNAWSIRGVYD
ncbi:MAG TPA: DNA polymerase Y family protein [Candidatus Lustribacter sp.]|jgi:protein ImuB|nr:DNA polymerase Y family protein [Candidatus Lustribacter sp.]